MNVEIGTEAAQFPEKEYINGIFNLVLHLPEEKEYINGIFLAVRLKQTPIAWLILCC
jgi:hypothetical protein